MKLRLKIHYNTVPGQNIYVCGKSKTLGQWNLSNALKMNYSTGGHWSVTLELLEKTNLLEYKYVMMDDKGNVEWEWGENRVILLTGKKSKIIHADETWRNPSKAEKPLFTSAFTNVIMRPGKLIKTPSLLLGKKQLEFRIQVPRVEPGFQVCVLGNTPKLGNWSNQKPLLLDGEGDFPFGRAA